MQKTEKVLASQSQEGWGPWREARLMNTGEKNFSPHSALGLSSKEQRRPQATAGEAAFRPGGPGKAFPAGLQAQCPVSEGQASVGGLPLPQSPGSWGGGEGIHQAPPARPAATEPSGSNIPSPLKGEVTASKLRPSKALQLGGEDPSREGRINTKRPFLALPLRGPSSVRESAPGLVGNPPQG